MCFFSLSYVKEPTNRAPAQTAAGLRMDPLDGDKFNANTNFHVFVNQSVQCVNLLL